MTSPANPPADPSGTSGSRGASGSPAEDSSPGGPATAVATGVASRTPASARATRPEVAVPAARSTLAVLRLLAARPEPVPAAAIARDLGLPRSTVYKLLRVLVDEGFVAHFPEDRRYGLGVAAYELGSAYSRHDGLVRLARPLVDRLVARTTHNAHLAVLHGRDVLYLVEARAPGRPTLVSDVGVRLPAPLTASGLALLSATPPAQVRALFPDPAAFVQRHGTGPAGPSALRTALTDVRRRGYALEDGTVTPGLGSVAVAAHDHAGMPVAALSVTYPTARGPRDEQPPDRAALAAEVAAAAAELTTRVRGRH